MLFTKRKKVDIIQDKLYEDNLDLYFDTTVKLYNQTYYEVALIGFERLAEYKDEYRISLIPHIEKCRHIKNMKPTREDMLLFENRIMLKKFRGLIYMKYITGFLSVLFLLIMIQKSELISSIYFSFLKAVGGAYPPNLADYSGSFRLFNLILAVIFAIISAVTYSITKKYAISKGLVRCKYCGKYIRYIDPNTPKYDSEIANNCRYCGRMYPVPDFYWDSWEGLEYIKQQHSVPEPEFYNELLKLKENYNKEYEEWKQKFLEKKNL